MYFQLCLSYLLQRSYKNNTKYSKSNQKNHYRVRTILSTGPKIWNDLPNDVKTANSLGHFIKE